MAAEGGDGVAFESATEYPNNVTLANMAYFMAVPTLCYELNFPRSV